MTETTDTVTEQSQDQWSMVPRYERWIESLGIPIHRSYFIDDLRTIEVGPWEERECDAAIVVLTGGTTTTSTWGPLRCATSLSIPPGISSLVTPAPQSRSSRRTSRPVSYSRQSSRSAVSRVRCRRSSTPARTFA